MTPEFAIRDARLYERPVRFTAPFRFGAVTVESAPQAFVRVEIELADGRRGEGATAEMTIPKWFDKRESKSAARTVTDLRRSLALACGFYLSDGKARTAFSHHTEHLDGQIAACGQKDIPPLAALYGPALLDKAILDALLRVTGMDVFSGFHANIAGLDNRLTPDIGLEAVESFLRNQRVLRAVFVRHTVGMRDELNGPNGLSAIAAQNGCRYFKLKLGGNVEEDCRRLTEIGAELAKIPFESKVTLDANEQYNSVADLKDLLSQIQRTIALEPIRSRLLYIEQPFSRDMTFEHSLSEMTSPAPFIIDEADSSYDAFPRAAALGYSGVSSKSCKGVYKSILNAVRARLWNGSSQTQYFLAAEDLTCQAGLAVQQDTALAAFLNIEHAERNGHHYGSGFGSAPAKEAEGFLGAHPDFYRPSDVGIKLAIADGMLCTGSLACPGFASGVHPDWASLTPLEEPTPASKEQRS